MLAQLFAFSLLIPAVSGAETLSFDGGKVRAEATFTKGPFANAKKESVLHIELLDTKGARKVDLKTKPAVEFEMDMASGTHGPGAPVEVANGSAQNEFDATQIYFTMGGEWIGKVTLTFQDGKTETQEFKVNVR